MEYIQNNSICIVFKSIGHVYIDVKNYKETLRWLSQNLVVLSGGRKGLIVERHLVGTYMNNSYIIILWSLYTLCHIQSFVPKLFLIIKIK